MLVCLTANHRNAGFDLLDRLSVAAPQATAELVATGPAVRGAVVIATCNRFETYLDVDADDPDAHRSVDHTIQVMSSAGSVDSGELRDAVSVIVGDRVPQHLFAVAAGLESVVVGEDEISGQVARSYELARADGTTTSALDRLFQRAARTSREVRSRSDLGGAGRSLVRLALELAGSRIPSFAEARVLVVGTGSYAATTLASLHGRGARDIAVYSATGRATRFAAKYGVRAVDSLADALERADLVITCTARYTIGPDDLRGARPRLLVDLGMPHNIDAAVRDIPGIEVLDLSLIALHAPLPELSSGGARTLVETAASEFTAERASAPAVVALRRHVLDATEAEIARAAAHAADAEEAARTARALRHLAGALLHTPSTRARDLALGGRAADFARGVEAVFGVSPAEPAGEAPAGSSASAS
ncbi:MAG: glutamyl-tRNA reductase [Micrococcales bacterium]|nr:glutamyl-tRNA reductase [Micrococcales bacterium]